MAPSESNQYIEEHESFAASRVSQFVFVDPTEDLFPKLDNYVDVADGDICPPFVLVGEEGSGKSAVLANWASQRLAHKHRDEFLFQHYVGCTAQSLQLAHTLSRLENLLKSFFQLREMKVPESEVDLRWSLSRFLDAAVKKHNPSRIIIIIDGIHRLKSEGNEGALYWLPVDYPPCVRFIVSTVQYDRSNINKTLKYNNNDQPHSGMISNRDNNNGSSNNNNKDSNNNNNNVTEHSTYVELVRRKCKLTYLNQLNSKNKLNIINNFLHVHGNKNFQLNESQNFKITSSDITSQPIYLRSLLQSLRLTNIHTGASIDDLLEKFLLYSTSAHDLISKTFNICCHANEHSDSMTMYDYLADPNYNRSFDANGTSNDESILSIMEGNGQMDNSSVSTCSVGGESANGEVNIGIKKSNSSGSISPKNTINPANSSSPSKPVSTIDLINCIPIGPSSGPSRIILDEPHGTTFSTLLSKMMSIVYVSRNGLTEEEIWGILKMNGATEINMYQKIRLMSILKDYTMIISNMYSFSHEIYREVVYNKYITSKSELINWHKVLADFFNELPPCHRKLVALPYHLEMTGSWSKVKNCLTEIEMFRLWWTQSFKNDFLKFWYSLTYSNNNVNNNNNNSDNLNGNNDYYDNANSSSYTPGFVGVANKNRPVYDVVDEYVKSLDEYRNLKHPSDEVIAGIILEIGDFLLEFATLGYEQDADVPSLIHPKVLTNDLKSIGVPYIEVDSDGRFVLNYPKILQPLQNNNDTGIISDAPTKAIDDVPVFTNYYYSRWMWIQFPYIALGNCFNRYHDGIKQNLHGSNDTGTHNSLNNILTQDTLLINEDLLKTSDIPLTNEKIKNDSNSPPKKTKNKDNNNLSKTMPSSLKTSSSSPLLSSTTALTSSSSSSSLVQNNKQDVFLRKKELQSVNRNIKSLRTSSAGNNQNSNIDDENNQLNTSSSAFKLPEIKFQRKAARTIPRTPGPKPSMESLNKTNDSEGNNNLNSTKTKNFAQSSYEDEESKAMNSQVQLKLRALKDNILNYREELNYTYQMKIVLKKKTLELKDNLIDLQRTSESCNMYDNELANIIKKEKEVMGKYNKIKVINKNLKELLLICNRHPANIPALITELQNKIKQDNTLISEIKKRLWEHRYELQSSKLTFNETKNLTDETISMLNKLVNYKKKARNMLVQQLHDMNLHLERLNNTSNFSNSTSNLNNMNNNSSQSSIDWGFNRSIDSIASVNNKRPINLEKEPPKSPSSNMSSFDDNSSVQVSTNNDVTPILEQSWEETWAMISSCTGFVDPDLFFARINEGTNLEQMIKNLQVNSELRHESLKKEAIDVERELENCGLSASEDDSVTTKSLNKKLFDSLQENRQLKEKISALSLLSDQVMSGLAHISDLLCLPKSLEDNEHIIKDIEAFLDTLINEREKQQQQQQPHGANTANGSVLGSNGSINGASVLGSTTNTANLPEGFSPNSPELEQAIAKYEDPISRTKKNVFVQKERKAEVSAALALKQTITNPNNLSTLIGNLTIQDQTINSIYNTYSTTNQIDPAEKELNECRAIIKSESLNTLRNEAKKGAKSAKAVGK